MVRQRRHGDDVARLDALIARAKSRLRFANSFVSFPDNEFWTDLIRKSLLTKNYRGRGDEHVRIRDGIIEATAWKPREPEVFIPQPAADVPERPAGDEPPDIPPPPEFDFGSPLPGLIRVEDVISVFGYSGGEMLTVIKTSGLSVVGNANQFYVWATDEIAMKSNPGRFWVEVTDSLKLESNANRFFIDESSGLYVQGDSNRFYVDASSSLFVSGLWQSLYIDVSDSLVADTTIETAYASDWRSLVTVEGNAIVDPPFYTPGNVSDSITLDTTFEFRPPYFAVDASDELTLDTEARITIFNIPVSDSLTMEDAAVVRALNIVAQDALSIDRTLFAFASTIVASSAITVDSVLADIKARVDINASDTLAVEANKVVIKDIEVEASDSVTVNTTKIVYDNPPRLIDKSSSLWVVGDLYDIIHLADFEVEAIDNLVLETEEPGVYPSLSVRESSDITVQTNKIVDDGAPRIVSVSDSVVLHKHLIATGPTFRTVSDAAVLDTNLNNISITGAGPVVETDSISMEDSVTVVRDARVTSAYWSFDSDLDGWSESSYNDSCSGDGLYWGSSYGYSGGGARLEGCEESAITYWYTWMAISVQLVIGREYSLQWRARNRYPLSLNWGAIYFGPGDYDPGPGPNGTPEVYSSNVTWPYGYGSTSWVNYVLPRTYTPSKSLCFIAIGVVSDNNGPSDIYIDNISLTSVP